MIELLNKDWGWCYNKKLFAEKESVINVFDRHSKLVIVIQ